MRVRFSLVPLAVLLSLFNPMSSAAQWQPDGVRVAVEVSTKYFPTMTPDGTGGAVIAWQDDRNGFYDIYTQRLDTYGVRQWGTGGVAVCTASNEQLYPTITTDGSGGAIVVWADTRGSSYDIYAQRVDASGTPQWTADGVAICTAMYNQDRPQIASDGAGGAIMVWEDDRPAGDGSTDIYVQRVNASGAPQWTANGVAVCTAGNRQAGQCIAADMSGGAFLAWVDYRGGTYSDIYVQQVNSAGTPQWTADGTPVCTALFHQGGPFAISDGVGGMLVAWHDDRVMSQDIYAQRINAAGTSVWTDDGNPVCVATGAQATPQLTLTNPAGVIVAWPDLRNGNTDVYAQWLDLDGTEYWANDGEPVCTATGDQLAVRIVPDGAGSAIIGWYDDRSGSRDIYAQRVNLDGTSAWTTDGVAVCTASGEQFLYSMIDDGAGNAILAWEDTRDSPYRDIYAQKIEGDGTVSAVDGPSRTPRLVAGQFYPNPSTGGAVIDVAGAASRLSMEVFDVKGRLLRTVRLSGITGRRVEFDGRDGDGGLLPSGIYFVRLSASGATAVRKLVVTR